MSKSNGAPRALPENPNLEHLKKQARTLLNSARAGTREAHARLLLHHPRFSQPRTVAGARVTLSAAQLVIAREYGFSSWPKLKSHVLGRATSTGRTLPSGTEAATQRLYERLEQLARRIDWVSKPELVRLREAFDLPGLIAAAAKHCDEPTKQGLLGASDPLARVVLVCDALDARLREPAPVAIGVARDSTPAAHAEAEACLAVLYAGSYPHLLGRRYALTEPCTRLGRSENNQVVLHSDSVSRVHALIQRRGSEFELIDQSSTNGSFVGDAPEAIERRTLTDGDRIVLGDFILCFLRGPELEAKYRAAVEYIAQHDALTGILNQKSWLAETERQVLYARGSNHPLSALLFEVDQIHTVTERFGRLGGNALLRLMAQLLRRELGDGAIIGRRVDDRFAVTLPGCGEVEAVERGARLCAEISAKQVKLFDEAVEVTASVGWATLFHTTGLEELVGDAQAGLKRARRALVTGL